MPLGVAVSVYIPLTPTRPKAPFITLLGLPVLGWFGRPVACGVARVVEDRFLTKLHYSLQVSYISAVTLFGFPVLLDLRSRIQTARIDSIMKGN